MTCKKTTENEQVMTLKSFSLSVATFYKYVIVAMKNIYFQIDIG